MLVASMMQIDLVCLGGILIIRRFISPVANLLNLSAMCRGGTLYKIRPYTLYKRQKVVFGFVLYLFLHA